MADNKSPVSFDDIIQAGMSPTPPLHIYLL